MLLCLAASSTADTAIYLHRGADGEISFSDTATIGAERIEIAIPPARQEPLDSTAQIEQMLRVADALATARQAREAARARQRERLARTTQQSTPPPVAESRVYYPYLPYDGRYRKPHRPGHDTDAPKPPVDERPIFKSRLNASR